MQAICRNTWCQQSFEVTDEDLKFYDNISPTFNGQQYSIPPPTLCYDCRLQRRLAHRNDRKLYSRNDSFTGKRLISMFHPDTNTPVIHKDDWFGDNWNPLNYGQEYDFKKPFFQQFAELIARVPRPNLITIKTENAAYTNYNSSNKNCYLCFAGNYAEDSYYCYHAEMSNDCCDCHYVYKCELCYESVQCEHCYNTHFSLHSNGCKDCWFIEDCSECSNCLLCWNLHRKEYCILNKQYSKEEYKQKLTEYNLQTHSGIQAAKEVWKQERLKHPKRAKHNRMDEQCSGEYLTECNRCTKAFNVASGCEDCRYIFNGFPDLKDAMDCTFSGEKTELLYECMASGENCNNMLFGNICCTNSFNLLYCDWVFNTKNCFGCTCLNKQEYCILNKQYSKQEYEELVPNIIEHMQSTGEWGEFFPVEESLFTYNESHAQEYYPLAKEEIEQRGWAWREPSDKIPNVEKTIQASRLPESIDDIPDLSAVDPRQRTEADDVLNWAIVCTETGRPFRIVKQELEYYRKLKLPLPQLHPDVRHEKRVNTRKNHHLHTRQCAKCSKQIETPYKPDAPEIVFCEECYLNEVY